MLLEQHTLEQTMMLAVARWNGAMMCIQLCRHAKPSNVSVQRKCQASKIIPEFTVDGLMLCFCICIQAYRYNLWFMGDGLTLWRRNCVAAGLWLIYRIKHQKMRIIKTLSDKITNKKMERLQQTSNYFQFHKMLSILNSN